MSFGRRTNAPMPIFCRGQKRTGVEFSALKPRRSGYMIALAGAALAFVASDAIAVAWAFTHTKSTSETPLGIFLMALVGVGPIAIVNYAIALAIVAVVTPALRLSGVVAYP